MESTSQSRAIHPKPVIIQAPGYSPPNINRPREYRHKYNDLQLAACYELSRTIGTELACKQMCVTKPSFYYYARVKGLQTGKAVKKRKAKIAKYTSEQLTKVVKKAFEWHRNAGGASSMRKCCERAGEFYRINGSTAYGFWNEHREEFRSGAR